jgi:type I site-specific restriction-modification system R (restriction) subunit
MREHIEFWSRVGSNFKLTHYRRGRRYRPKSPSRSGAARPACCSATSSRTCSPGSIRGCDKEFFDLAEAEGITDIDELNRVLDRAVGLRTFLTADDRVEKVAAFVAEHFRESVLPLGYKAFLVGVNREACAKYKRALDKLLPPEWSEAVYTENAADVIDRPLVAELQISEQRESDARLLFKKANDNPKILIVTDKLLTGCVFRSNVITDSGGR